jgi:hypothetical protein
VAAWVTFAAAFSKIKKKSVSFGKIFMFILVKADVAYKKMTLKSINGIWHLPSFEASCISCVDVKKN